MTESDMMNFMKVAMTSLVKTIINSLIFVVKNDGVKFDDGLVPILEEALKMMDKLDANKMLLVDLFENLGAFLGGIDYNDTGWDDVVAEKCRQIAELIKKYL